MSFRVLFVFVAACFLFNINPAIASVLVDNKSRDSISADEHKAPADVNADEEGDEESDEIDDTESDDESMDEAEGEE